MVPLRWAFGSSLAALACLGGATLAQAADGFDLSLPAANAAPAPIAVGATNGAAAPRTEVGGYFDTWAARVAAARASQPAWSSPLITTTALLEERARYDISFQNVGNGSDTANYGSGKGVDLIVGATEEVQIGEDPYIVHTTPSGHGQYQGFADWPVIRFKQRLASSPEDAGNYIVAAWLQLQAPAGIDALTNRAYTLLPTVGFGKGWGPVVIQGTIGATIPTAYQTTLGTQLTANLALQYRLLKLLWPQIEANWTSYFGGLRDGKHQLYLTPGLVIGRFPISDQVKLTVGVGYQTAVAPGYRAKPLLPSYDHAFVTTFRIGF